MSKPSATEPGHTLFWDGQFRWCPRCWTRFSKGGQFEFDVSICFNMILQAKGQTMETELSRTSNGKPTNTPPPHPLYHTSTADCVKVIQSLHSVNGLGPSWSHASNPLLWYWAPQAWCWKHKYSTSITQSKSHRNRPHIRGTGFKQATASP